MGEGGQAKVFKAKFHGKDVAMKFISLDHVKSNYRYECNSIGCHEFYGQEKLFIDLLRSYFLLFLYKTNLGQEKLWI